MVILILVESLVVISAMIILNFVLVLAILFEHLPSIHVIFVIRKMIADMGDSIILVGELVGNTEATSS